ncbi:MAG: 50S ribosomal protein L30 [Acidimicrobiales bacterium]
MSTGSVVSRTSVPAGGAGDRGPSEPKRSRSRAKTSTREVASGPDVTSLDPRIQVTMVRSSIGARPKHRGGLRALGLRRIGHTRNLPDRPEIRGMIARVSHLVEVKEIPGAGEGRTHSKRRDT